MTTRQSRTHGFATPSKTGSFNFDWYFRYILNISEIPAVYREMLEYRLSQYPDLTLNLTLKSPHLKSDLRNEFPFTILLLGSTSAVFKRTIMWSSGVYC